MLNVHTHPHANAHIHAHRHAHARIFGHTRTRTQTYTNVGNLRKQRTSALDLRSERVVALARSELGESYHLTVLGVTLGVVLVDLVAGIRRAATVRRQAHPQPRAARHCGVRLPVLLIHDDVDDRIHARREVQQQVSQNVKF